MTSLSTPSPDRPLDRTPVQRVLAALSDAGCGPKAQSGKANQWLSRCPAHEDSTPSLSIGEGTDGRALLKCHAGCELGSIGDALGLRIQDLFVAALPARASVTVEELAEAKGLPVELLKACGVRNYRGFIRIDYAPSARYRKRTQLCAKDGSFWGGDKALPIVPYGLFTLPEAQESGYLILVEGESDCWTLWLHGFIALGIPGAQMARTLTKAHLTGIRKIYIHQEPDKGGASFASGVSRRLRELMWHGDCRILRMPEGIKDPNELHKRLDGDRVKFVQALDEAMEKAEAVASPSHDHRLEALVYFGRMRELTPPQCKFYLGLLALEPRLPADNEGFFPASYSLIEAETGLHDSSIRECQQALAEKGFISIRRGSRKVKDNRPNRYRLESVPSPTTKTNQGALARGGLAPKTERETGLPPIVSREIPLAH